MKKPFELIKINFNFIIVYYLKIKWKKKLIYTNTIFQNAI